jgi:hypothetical protein
MEDGRRKLGMQGRLELVRLIEAGDGALPVASLAGAVGS